MEEWLMVFFFLVGIFISSIFAHFVSVEVVFKMFSINKCKLGFDVWYPIYIYTGNNTFALRKWGFVSAKDIFLFLSSTIDQ